MQNKLISNREMFRQLLAKDILAIIEDVNSGTWVDVHYLRNNLHNSLSARHYMNLHTSKGHCYTSFSDRFYRNLQSINDAGYGLTIRKDKQTGKLFVFNTDVLKRDNWTQLVAESFTAWRTCYKSNRGYELNTQLDEVA
jgi:hypothetical protein